MRKIFFGIVGVILLAIAGRACYMVACISCTTPDIKEYNFSQSMDDFEALFKAFASKNKDVAYKLTRRGIENYAARDLIVTVKNKYVDVVYDLVIHDFNGQTKVSLSRITDNKRNISGHSLEDPLIKNLFEDFKNNFLSRLQKDVNIELDPVSFAF